MRRTYNNRTVWGPKPTIIKSLELRLGWHSESSYVISPKIQHKRVDDFSHLAKTLNFSCDFWKSYSIATFFFLRYKLQFTHIHTHARTHRRTLALLFAKHSALTDVPWLAEWENPFTVKFQGHGRFSLIKLQQQFKTDQSEDNIHAKLEGLYHRFNLVSVVSSWLVNKWWYVQSETNLMRLKKGLLVAGWQPNQNPLNPETTACIIHFIWLYKCKTNPDPCIYSKTRVDYTLKCCVSRAQGISAC